MDTTTYEARPPIHPLLGARYFPGLDELRGLAALTVLPGHFEVMKQRRGLPDSPWFPVPGKIGVVLFFVLSGFLITALLLKEIGKAGTVNLGGFYRRRALRIWPLYYLMFVVVFFGVNHLRIFYESIYPGDSYDRMDLRNYLVWLLLVPTYATVRIPFLTHFWSIGVEEQFYCLQPFVFKFFKSVTLIGGAMFSAIFMVEIFEGVKWWFGPPIKDYLDYFSPGVTKWFGCIAVGSFAAVFCFRFPRMAQQFLHHTVTQIAAIVSLVLFIIAINTGRSDAAKIDTIVDYRLISAAFVVIIVNAATNPQSICSLQNEMLAYLGKVSFGIYVYHPLCFAIVLRSLPQYIDHDQSPVLFNMVSYAVAVGLAVAVSAVSYRYFESFFLSFKSPRPRETV